MLKKDANSRRERSQAVWACRRKLPGSGSVGCDDDDVSLLISLLWVLLSPRNSVSTVDVYIYIYICIYVYFVTAQWQLWQQQSNTLQFCHQPMKTVLQIPDVRPGLIYFQIFTAVKEASKSSERVNIESLNCSTFNSLRKWGCYRRYLPLNRCEGDWNKQDGCVLLGKLEGLTVCLRNSFGLTLDGFTWPWPCLRPSP